MILPNKFSFITLILFVFYSNICFSSENISNNKIRIGAGDSKIGYETNDYTTDSKAIEARQGERANLIRVVKTPPLGLPPIHVPADNPITEKKIALGRKLFFDRRLSINNTFLCYLSHSRTRVHQ